MGTLIRGLAVTAFAALLLGACDAFGPDGGRLRVVFQPSFAETAADGEENPALLVDNVRVVVVNEAGDTVIDQIVAWPLDQDTLRIEVAIEVEGAETFNYALEGREGETTLFSTGLQELELTSGGSQGTMLVQPVLQYSGAETSLVALSITGAPAVLAAGQTVELGATGTDSLGGTHDDPLLRWTSLDTLVATVNEDGVVVVKDVASRTARIVARVAFRTLADTLELPVQPARIELSTADDTINALGFRVMVVVDPQTVDGARASGAQYTWTSSDPAVLRVAQSRRDTATVSGVSVGQAMLIVTSGTTADTASFTVRQVVKAVAVLPTRFFIGAGDQLTLSAIAVDSGGSIVPNVTFAWSSTSDAVMTVGPTDGVVTGQSSGNADVQARSDGVSGAGRGRVVGSGTGGVAVGDYHVCRLNETGVASCWGENLYGQLGNGTFSDSGVVQVTPVDVAGGHTFSALAGGGNHACGIATDGKTYCWGGNDFGQLGDGTQVNRSTPVEVAGGHSFAALSLGGRHSCGLTAAGAAHCWGLNDFGALGDGRLVDQAAPVAVAGGIVFASIAAGGLHTCGLTAAGEAYCWGRATEGQLGTGLVADTALPALVTGGHTFTALNGGAAHTCGVTTAFDAFCWGYNSSGQLGIGSVDNALTPAAVAGGLLFDDVAAGWIHTCARTTAGEIHCWGSNAALELGRGSPRAARVPTLVALGVTMDNVAGGGRRACGLKGSNLVCWGGVPPEQLGRETLVIP